MSRLGERIEDAPPSSPVRQDYASAEAGGHGLAFKQTFTHLEALNFGVYSNLRGLESLMKHDTFYAVPATLVARAICEGAATCAWLLDPKATSPTSEPHAGMPRCFGRSRRPSRRFAPTTP